jgi:lysophospholipase L1-like esterase
MRVARKTHALALASGLIAALMAGTPAAADPGPPPSSMASMGDSITRAFNASGWYSDWPSRSFSTGTYSGVSSHYRRILAKNPAISGHNYNDAVSGAKVADMPGQANTVANRNVQYVTILIGANDACTSSEASMTPVATYRSHIDTTLATLKSRLPDAKVALISIPDINRQGQLLGPRRVERLRHLPVDAGQPDLHRPGRRGPPQPRPPAGHRLQRPARPGVRRLWAQLRLR